MHDQSMDVNIVLANRLIRVAITHKLYHTKFHAVVSYETNQGERVGGWVYYPIL